MKKLSAVWMLVAALMLVVVSGQALASGTCGIGNRPVLSGSSAMVVKLNDGPCGNGDDDGSNGRCTSGNCTVVVDNGTATKASGRNGWYIDGSGNRRNNCFECGVRTCLRDKDGHFVITKDVNIAITWNQFNFTTPNGFTVLCYPGSAPVGQTNVQLSCATAFEVRYGGGLKNITFNGNSLAQLLAANATVTSCPISVQPLTTQIYSPIVFNNVKAGATTVFSGRNTLVPQGTGERGDILVTGGDTSQPLRATCQPLNINGISYDPSYQLQAIDNSVFIFGSLTVPNDFNNFSQLSANLSCTVSRGNLSANVQVPVSVKVAAPVNQYSAVVQGTLTYPARPAGSSNVAPSEPLPAIRVTGAANNISTANVSCGAVTRNGVTIAAITKTINLSGGQGSATINPPANYSSSATTGSADYRCTVTAGSNTSEVIVPASWTVADGLTATLNGNSLHAGENTKPCVIVFNGRNVPTRTQCPNGGSGGNGVSVNIINGGTSASLTCPGITLSGPSNQVTVDAVNVGSIALNNGAGEIPLNTNIRIGASAAVGSYSGTLNCTINSQINGQNFTTTLQVPVNAVVSMNPPVTLVENTQLRIPSVTPSASSDCQLKMTPQQGGNGLVAFESACPGGQVTNPGISGLFTLPNNGIIGNSCTVNITGNSLSNGSATISPQYTYLVNCRGQGTLCVGVEQTRLPANAPSGNYTGSYSVAVNCPDQVYSGTGHATVEVATVRTVALTVTRDVAFGTYTLGQAASVFELNGNNTVTRLSGNATYIGGAQTGEIKFVVNPANSPAIAADSSGRTPVSLQCQNGKTIDSELLYPANVTALNNTVVAVRGKVFLPADSANPPRGLCTGSGNITYNFN